MADLREIVDILAATLQLGEKAQRFDANTPLLGSIAELDSMAVVGVITALEERYGFVVDDDEISADTFQTVGSLHEFVERKLSS
jgi:acyl carrier protein